jgi:hypothetical protein
MSPSNETTSLLAAVGAATVSLVLSLAVTSTIALAFINARIPGPALTRYAAAQPAEQVAPSVVDTAARS